MTNQDQSSRHAQPICASGDKAGHPGYCDLVESSTVYQIETIYRFTPLMIRVGTIYFRRLAATNQAMLLVACSHSSFSALVEGLTFKEPGKPLVGAIHARYLTSNEVWLTLIHLTCTYIASKAVEDAPHVCCLQTILSHIYGVESCSIDPEMCSDLELECLEALEWRIGFSLVSQDDLPHAAVDSEDTATNLCLGCVINMKEPSAPAVEVFQPVYTPELYSLSKAQGSSPHFGPSTSKLERSVSAWHQHKAVHCAWMLASIFVMMPLLATCSNIGFTAVALIPSVLGQQTAYWGLAFLGWATNTQRIRAKWFLKAVQASAIVTAFCSAAVAAVIACVTCQGAAVYELSCASTNRLPILPMKLFIGVLYALHAVVSIIVANHARQAQSILEQDDTP